jgi:EPS-associated MarR family transcriptional regulator
VLNDEMRYKLIRLFSTNTEISQRAAARELGISLGKLNFCVRALVARGLIKAKRFKNSNNKAAYMYLLTPRGLDAKATLTLRFLEVKMREYEKLRGEIDEMRREAEGLPPP